METLTLSLPPAMLLTDELLYQLSQANQDLRLERTVQGELIVMSPAGGETSRRNLDIAFQLQAWSRSTLKEGTPLGVAFDSSAGFRLPNGATRSPDASWVRRERWEALTLEQREKFPPLCPDFVIELCSPSDALAVVQAKMQEYITNGACLGWLIAPKTQQVEIYRALEGTPPAVEILPCPTTLSGEAMLPGFVLDLTQIFGG